MAAGPVVVQFILRDACGVYHRAALRADPVAGSSGCGAHRLDRIRQLPPWLHRPVARGRAGWRGQHEGRWEILLWRLPAQHNRLRWPAIEQARGFLAGEGDSLRPIAPHLFPEACNVDREGECLMVHASAELAKIGEADTEFQQRGKFMRFVSAQRDTDLVDRPPKAIAGPRVVMACVG
jgi:hypothetical protein